MPNTDSLGLYVHLPFCRVHCTYCPFAISTDLALQDRYFDALLSEIGDRSGPGRPAVQTLYLGGGTPSRSSMANLLRLAATLQERFDVAADAEFTIEANPEDITDEALGAWQAMGANRVSIGVQSFHDHELAPLGRVHGGDGAVQAVRAAVDSGLRTTVDLMLGLPGQTRESFCASLSQAIDAGMGHLSLYMLDLEEGTTLHGQVKRGRAVLPEDDLVAELYAEAIDTLAAVGLMQYEVSNFARAGQESRHNLRYWQRDHYHGFGLGAHSFLGDERFGNSRDMHRYLAAPGVPDFHETLGQAEQRRETIFLNLRQAAGIQSDELVRLCGQEGIEWIDRGLEGGWLRRNGSRVAFTAGGFLLSSEYISQLF